MAEEKIYEKVASQLNLNPNETLIATAFWIAFGETATKPKKDKDADRNALLLSGLQSLGALFSKITVSDIDHSRQVPFYTVEVFQHQLILPSGDFQYNFKASVDTPNLSRTFSRDYNTVKIGLPPLSLAIIEGSAKIHQQFSQKRLFRPDLTSSSDTLKIHFVQAILAVADFQLF